MSLLKKIQLGNSEVEIYDSDISNEKKKENLNKLYQTINEIAQEKIENKINVDDWFFSKSELEKIKKDNSYNFL